MPNGASKKKLMTWGIVAAVAVVVVVGGLVWHSQPSFCGSVCHTPMATYVEGYESGDDALLVATHAAAGKECLDCHEPTISQQVMEGTHWITGNYALGSNGKLASRGDELATAASCLAAGCHDMTRQELTEKTADLAFNPHDDSQPGHSDVACASCHSMHGESVMYCTRCHSEALASAPDGWLTFSETAQK